MFVWTLFRKAVLPIENEPGEENTSNRKKAKKRIETAEEIINGKHEKGFIPINQE